MKRYPFKVGDKVTSKFWGDGEIVRFETEMGLTRMVARLGEGRLEPIFTPDGLLIGREDCPDRALLKIEHVEET